MSRIGFLPLALLAASGCGGAGSLCEKWADEIEACDGDDFSVEDCEEDIAPCNSQDLDLLDDFYECATDAGLFECGEDTEDTTNLTEAFENLGAVFACAEPLEDLSEECQGEMMTGSTGAVF